MLGIDEPTRMKKIIIWIVCVLSVNAYADCPQFALKINDNIKVGVLPNGKPIYQVLSKNYMGFGHTEFLSILTTNTASLPENIEYCSDGNLDLFYFDRSTKAITQKEMENSGIIAILPFYDASIEVSTSFKGQWLLVWIKYYDIYGRDDHSKYLTYSWSMSSKKYKLTETKEVSNVALELYEMQYKIESKDLEQLYVLLNDFDYGGGYGSRLYRFPKDFSKDLWDFIHSKSLLLYNSGNKNKAAQLVSDLLKIVRVQLPDELEDEYRDIYGDYHFYDYYNFAVDALHQNKKLIPQISDCGFFLEQANLNLNEAILIFKHIIKLSPDRVVTYLNLADALWKNSDKESAQIAYKKYVSLMKSNNNEREIPDYVIKRTRTKSNPN